MLAGHGNLAYHVRQLSWAERRQVWYDTKPGSGLKNVDKRQFDTVTNRSTEVLKQSNTRDRASPCVPQPVSHVDPQPPVTHQVHDSPRRDTQQEDIVSPSSPPEGLVPSSGAVGSRVISKWKDGFYYPGTIKSSADRDSRCHVRFDDGDSRAVKLCDVLMIERLPVGQSVMVLTDKGDFVPGRILVAESQHYLVETDEGTSDRYSHSQVILTGNQASCVISDVGSQIRTEVPSTPGPPTNVGDVRLENLIDAPRRSAKKQPEVKVETEDKGQGQKRCRKRKIDELKHQTTSTPTPKGKHESVVKRKKGEGVFSDNPLGAAQSSPVSTRRSPRKTRVGLFTNYPGPIPTQKLFKTSEQKYQESSLLKDSSLETSTDESNVEAAGGAPLGFEQPGPSQPYQPSPGPTSYQQPPAGPSYNNLPLPGDNQYPGNTPSCSHAPPSTPQDPPAPRASPTPAPRVSPQPKPTARTTDWKPPGNPKISNQHQATAQYVDTEKINEATGGDNDNMKMENADLQVMPKISYTEYVRLLLLLHNAGFFILRAMLRSFVKSLNCKNVDDFLRPFKESLKPLPEVKNRLTELFPVNGNTDIEKWDITLLVAVLINCCTPLEKKTHVSRLKTIFRNLHGNIKSVLKDNEENIRKRISDYQCEIIFPSTFAPTNDTLDDWDVNLLLSVIVTTSQSSNDESIRQFMKDVITKEVVNGVSGNSSPSLATFLEKHKSKLMREQKRKQQYISDYLFKQIYPENSIPDVNTWDKEVLLFVLLGIMHSLPQSTIKSIKKIRDLRNSNAHPSSTSMQQAEFNLRWTEVYNTFKELVIVEMPSEIKTLETIAWQCGKQDINLDQENVTKILQESQDEQRKAVKDVQNEIQRKGADGYSLTDNMVKVEIRVLAPNEQIGQIAETRIKELFKDKDKSVSFIIGKLEVVDIQTGCVILFVRYSSLDQLSHLIGLVCGEDLKHHLDDVANKVNSEQTTTILASAHIPWLELQRIRRDISLIVQENHAQEIQSQSTAYMALSNSIEALTSGAIEEGFSLLSKKLSNELGQDIRVCPMLESSVFRNDVSKDVDIPPRVSEEQVKRDETAKLGEVSNVEKDPQIKEGYTEIRLEKKYQLDALVEKLKLQNFFPSKIHLQDITAIDLSDQEREKSMASLPWRFFNQIVLAKSTARDRNVYTYLKTLEDEDDDDDEADSEFDICPIDMFIAIFYCCDSMLKQFICNKLFMCRQAVPFMYDDLENTNNCILSFWPLRSIVAEWKNSKQVPTEALILDQPTKIVSFVRFGRPAYSKSKLQNDMLSVNKHDTFHNKDSPLGKSDRSLCQGYIEASWYLPSGHKNDAYDEFLTFLNVRGDLLTHFNQDQEQFIVNSSAVIVIIVDVPTLITNMQSIINFLNIGLNCYHIIVICQAKNDKTCKNEVLELKTAYSGNKGKELAIVRTRIKGKERNATDMEMIIEKDLNKLLKNAKQVKCNDLLSKTPYKCIKSDEQERECEAGKQYANTLLSEIKKSGPSEQWKQKITPLQYKDWDKLSKLKKQLQRSIKEIDNAEEIKNEIVKIKKRQSDAISEPIKHFIRIIVAKKDERNILLYFIEWLKIYLDGNSRGVLPILRKEYNREWQCLNAMKEDGKPKYQILKQEQTVKKCDQSVADASFGLEHLFREIGQIFESVTFSQNEKNVSNLPSLQEMSKAVAKIILYGYPFELLDGDASNIPIDWAKSVLNTFQKEVDAKKILTLSVLGIQSSGKSTFLNTMFGLKFAVSAGRCTRGVNIQMVKVLNACKNSFEYIMVIDSEGLRAPELIDQKKERDNELATFIIGLGDFTILNIKGENTADINDVLGITIHAFLRLKAVNKTLDLRQRCIFVHQNVSAINAEEKMEQGKQKLVESLNNITKEAAQSENLENITTFKQVIEFDESKHVWYIPDLWQGDPPMAAINKGYSEKVECLRSSIMDMALLAKSKSYKYISDIIVHADELWKGILSEDFVFSFRNSLEIKAYLQMESIYKNLAWKLECCAKNGIQLDIKSGFNDCRTNTQVEEQSENLFALLKSRLYEEEIKVSKEMKYYFDHSDYMEIIIDWKVNRLNNLKELTENLVKYLKKEIDILATERSVKIMTVFQSEKHREQLRAESIELAQEIKGHRISIGEKNDRFEKIWRKFVGKLGDTAESKIKSTKLMFVDVLQSFILNNDRALLSKELESYQHLKVDFKLKRLVGSFKKFSITEEFIDTNKLFFQFWKKNDKFLPMVENHANDMFRNIDDTIKSYTSKEGELKESEVKTILVLIKSWFEQNDTKRTELGFTLKPIFKARIYVIISCHASDLFDKHNVKYRENNGIEVTMGKYKADVRALFDGCLENREAEATASTLLGRQFKDFVYKQVNERLPLNVEVKLKPLIPCIKYHLIVEILEDLAQKDNFQDFMQYIHSPEKSAEYWVSNKCKDVLFGKKKVYQELAFIEINKLFDEIKRAIKKASKQCSSNGTVDDWIKVFTEDLKDCKMEIERFDLFKTIEVVNFSNLETNLKETISEIEQQLKDRFEAINVKSVTWLTNPYTNLSKSLWGCKHTCPFCGEPCTKGDEHSDVHTSIQHRPTGLIGGRFLETHEILLTSCNFNVQSDHKHNCVFFHYACNGSTCDFDCELKWHDFKSYRTFLPNWDIAPCGNMDATSTYWMWLMASHSKDLECRYGLVTSNIPQSWHKIKPTEAIESIRKIYKAN